MRRRFSIALKNLQTKLPIPERKIKTLIRKILKTEKISVSGQINICFTTNALIKKFNARYLKTNYSTDVLAFNLTNTKEKTLLADIMISTDTAIKQARIFKTQPQYELLLYVAHGILHILGYDDRTNSQSKLMRNRENKYVH